MLLILRLMTLQDPAPCWCPPSTAKGAWDARPVRMAILGSSARGLMNVTQAESHPLLGMILK